MKIKKTENLHKHIKGLYGEYDPNVHKHAIYFAEDKKKIIVDGAEYGVYWEELPSLEKLFPDGGCIINTHPIKEFSFKGSEGKWYSSDGQEGEYDYTGLTTITFKEVGEYILKFVNEGHGNGLESVTDNSVKSALMIGGSNGETYGVKPVNKNENAKLIFYDNITSIENSAFSWCKGFTGDLIIPENVTNIEGYAFSGWTGLSKIYVCEDTVLHSNWNIDASAEVIKYKKGETPWLD